MKVVILCGGQGTRLREETEYKPKPMVEIGGKPILWHIMKIYAQHGFTEFVLALGYRGDVIRDYFLNYEYYTNDFTVTLGSRSELEIHEASSEAGWKITLVETGASVMTGARVKQCQPYIDGDRFMLTYGDGLANINVKELAEYHTDHGRLGTITAVNPASRWGELRVQGDEVRSFMEKPVNDHSQGDVNGGFMIFENGFFKYLSDDPDCVLEKEPFEKLAHDGQLMRKRHTGYWNAMDTYRDYLALNEACENGRPPWFEFDL